MKRMPKDEYAAMKRNELKALQGKLDTFLKDSLASTDKIKELTAHYRISGLYNFSMYNSMLILMQGGTICQSYDNWKKLDRTVTKGEKSHISVFRPMFKKEENAKGEETTKLIGFKLAPVFDIKQTEGKALEYDHNSNEYMEIPYSKLVAMAENLSGKPVQEEFTGNARGYADGSKLVVSTMSNATDKAKTLLHELAHDLMHFSDKKQVSRDAKEVEAESVAHLVMSFLGMDFDLSKAYVAAWKNGIDEARTDLIIRTADKVIKKLKEELTDEEQFLVSI
jgi:antirestriction protein ArdC